MKKKPLEFELQTPYIELNKLLKITRLSETGGSANVAIINSEVKVNGIAAFEKRKKIRKGDLIEFMGMQLKVV